MAGLEQFEGMQVRGAAGGVTTEMLAEWERIYHSASVIEIAYSDGMPTSLRDRGFRAYQVDFMDSFGIAHKSVVLYARRPGDERASPERPILSQSSPPPSKSSNSWGR